MVAYALFIVVGLGAGVNGVLLPAQVRDYGVDRTTIGLTFFTFSAGFVLASTAAGPILHRYGTRLALMGAAAVVVVAELATAARPPFVAFVLIQIVAGVGFGMLESVLNAYLAADARSTALLNRLHAFFGVGAFLGPLFAAWFLTFTTWPAVLVALAGLTVALAAAAWVAYPGPAGDPLIASPAHAGGEASPARGLLPATLRQGTVLLGTMLLSLYVGLEIGVGNWGFTYLAEGRAMPELVAGYAMSGYWLGLTLGRFVLGSLTARLGLARSGLMYVSLIGMTASIALIWVVGHAGVASASFALLGFFLGPVFPTTMALAPDLTSARLAPTAIGIMNAGSTIGGAALPWLAGVVTESVAVWTLLPFALVLALLQLGVWWWLAARLRPAKPEPVPAAALAGESRT